MYSDKQISERIKEELKVQNISQAELGRRVHISKQNLNHYLNGRHIPSDNLSSIASALSCSPAYLIGLTDAKDPWKATAIDELGISETAVDTLMGKSPRMTKYLHANAITVDEAKASACMEQIAKLDDRKEELHKVAVAFLDCDAFEELLATLWNAVRFHSGAYQAKESIKLATHRVIDDEPALRVSEDRWAVKKEDVARYLNAAVLDRMKKVVEELTNEAHSILDNSPQHE